MFGHSKFLISRQTEESRYFEHIAILNFTVFLVAVLGSTRGPRGYIASHSHIDASSEVNLLSENRKRLQIACIQKGVVALAKCTAAPMQPRRARAAGIASTETTKYRLAMRNAGNRRPSLGASEPGHNICRAGTTSGAPLSRNRQYAALPTHQCKVHCCENPSRWSQRSLAIS